MSAPSITAVVIAALDAQYELALALGGHVSPLGMLPTKADYAAVESAVLMWASSRDAKLQYDDRVCSDPTIGRLVVLRFSIGWCDVVSLHKPQALHSATVEAPSLAVAS